MTTERPLPSRSDFEALRTQNAMYVDKTDWVHELAAGTSDRLFLARPPRRVMRSCLTRSLEASPVVLVLGLDKATQKYATVEVNFLIKRPSILSQEKYVIKLYCTHRLRCGFWRDSLGDLP